MKNVPWKWSRRLGRTCQPVAIKCNWCAKNCVEPDFDWSDVGASFAGTQQFWSVFSSMTWTNLELPAICWRGQQLDVLQNNNPRMIVTPWLFGVILKTLASTFHYVPLAFTCPLSWYSSAPSQPSPSQVLSNGSSMHCDWSRRANIHPNYARAHLLDTSLYTQQFLCARHSI